MKEILITSSVLITAILILRKLFRNVLSKRVQYALWGLVLVRLLVPVSLPAVDFSVLTAAQPIEEAVAVRISPQPAYVGFFDRTVQNRPAEGVQITPTENAVITDMGSPSEEGKNISTYEVLSAVWKVGMALVGLFFLLSNLRFWLRLRRCRKPYPVEGVSRRVYLVEESGFSSPFIFGLFKPAMYLTPAAVSSERSLRHVLAHEETHARHLDHIWALLRCVCLTVYWFDPFVWVAAACSKTDCELACDEGVIARLGEGQRIPYGETLLSLIPVHRGAGNPFITATTMAAKKRQIKDRLTFIVKKPKHIAAALAAVLVLMGIVTACTFTGAKTDETPDAPESDPQEPPESASVSDTSDESVPLTGDELRFFNEQWFNTGYPDIRNQFMSSVYEKPEDIDLYELLYCEGSTPTDEEIRTILGEDPDNMICPAYKLTAAEIDDILTRYMGLTLEETNKTGLDGFTYDAETDAYYSLHGDTNYRPSVEFAAGTTDGRTLKLYYNDEYMGDGWKCLTMTSTPGDVYHFVSNVPCDKPVIETQFPDVEPYAVLSLENIEPYSPTEVSVESHSGDFVNSIENRIENWLIGEHNIVIYRSTDGSVYAAERLDDDVMNVFLTVSEESSMAPYDDLFGHSGFYVDYPGQYDEHSWGIVREYFYFEDDGTLMRLARCETHGDGEPEIIDLNGDGVNELVSTRQFFFEKDGFLYEANMPELLEVTYTDHVVDGADTGVPEEVVAAAKDYAEGQLTRVHPLDGTYLGVNGEIIDDWRIESFSGPYTYDIDGVTVEAWAFNYEYHTTTPENVVLAGGKYLTEDDWESPGYPGADWMFFTVEGDTRTIFYRAMINDMSPYSNAFLEEIKANM